MSPQVRRTVLHDGLAVISLGVVFCAFIGMGASCRDENTTGGDAAVGQDAVGQDATTGEDLAIVIRNAGPGPAYLDGSYRAWCQTLFGLHRVDTGERLLLPNASLCRCDDCEATACAGMVSWVHFYVELPQGSALTYTWDRRYVGEPSLPDTCGTTGCYGALEAAAGEHEVRVSYSRQTPVCAVGEEPSVTGDFLTPPGLELPAQAVLHQCVPAESNQCAQVPLATSARFDRDATGIDVVLED